MPTWGQILQEIAAAPGILAQQGAPGVSPYDFVRRKYLAELNALTGRPTILYAAAWTTRHSAISLPELIQISNEDTHALMETVHGLPGPNLDLIIHSPGGSPTAAEAFVSYLRTKFDDIRVIIPNMAMSAATMIACAGNRIVMGKHSFLGPIDPQLIIQTALGPRAVPAQAIVAQFKRAVDECADPIKLRAWMPMLNQYGPDLLVTCENATKLSEELVSNWLEQYMFSGEPDAKERSAAISSWLAGHDNFLNHGRPLSRETLQQHGLKIEELEADQAIQDLVLSIFHAVSILFAQMPVVKVIENHSGKSFIKSSSNSLPQAPIASFFPAPGQIS